MPNNLLATLPEVPSRLGRVTEAVNFIRGAFADLASVASGKGASAVGVQDSANLIAATDVEAALAELASRVGTQLVTFTMSAAPESAQAIVVTANLVDLNNTPVSRAQKFKAEVLLAAGILATAAQFRLSETGAGSELSTTANPTMLMSTDANGDAVITVLDQAGTYTGLVYLVLTPISDGASQFFGVPRYIALTFA